MEGRETGPPPVQRRIAISEDVARSGGLAPTPLAADQSHFRDGHWPGNRRRRRAALESVTVPSYVLDTTGVVRWINPAAERLLGDIRGRHYTSVVAPEDRPARPRAVLAEGARHLPGHRGDRLPGFDGWHAGGRGVSAVPLMSGERVVGVFGLIEERPDDTPTAPPPHLTPRQVEVLRLLEQGRSTKQIAAELHLSTETVKNHVRRVFRALGVHSRLEAVAVARAVSPY